MGSLLAQSLKILKDATIEQGKEYMGNAVELVNDANAVRTDVMRAAKNSTDTLKNMKRNFNFRGIHDWFYQKESEFGDTGEDDDYDPGFDTGAEEDKDSTVLDKDAMKDITKRQSSIMVQLGARQAETTMASTAEVVSTINQRSSEILTSVNNINTTLLGISKKLDAFCNVYQAEKTEQAKMSLYDSQGRLSLNSIYNTAKNSGGGYIGDAMGYGSMLSMLKGAGPSDILQMAYQMSGLGGKELKILGGRSIDKTMETINNTLGEAVQRGLEDLISSKPFKTLFGDIKRGESTHNYKEDVVKGIDNKQATFDGYVRTTIIKTIPEYLRIIAKGVTGMNYNVGKNGELTQGTSTLGTKAREKWEKDEEKNREQYRQERWGDLAKSSFQSSGVSWKGRNQLFEERTNKDLSRADISMITNTLNGVFAQLIYESNINRLDPNRLLSDSKLTEAAIVETATIMAASLKKKGIDWMSAVRSVFLAIAQGEDARNFCNGVNKTYQDLHVKRTEFASSGSSFSSLAGKVDMSSVREAAVKQNKRTSQVSDTIDKLEDAKEQMRQYDKMKGPEKLRHSEDIRNLKEQIKEFEKILREHGSGNSYNQSAYGNYLNIARNGCGPVALADMLNRRGMYDPKHGMNVGNFMNASAMMGHPLTPGAVNNMSLRMASGDNPITLLGSGPEFGTAYGNNHFVNVIGSDGGGNVYVMNPLDGKVHKRSINGVAGSSLVGLYGGGIGDSIRGKFDEFMSRKGDELYDSAKDKASSFISEHFGGASDKYDKYLEKSLKRAQDYGNRDDISQEDKYQMDLVMSMMETSAEDGDSGPDKQAIMMEISRIKNQKLKARLRAAVGGMIDRSAKKSEKGGLLSKLFSAGKGILKNFFAPLIAGITTALKTAFGAAKKFMSPVINFFKKQLQKNIGKITTGAKQVWQGTKELFKKKEKPEGESEEKKPGRLRSFLNSRKKKDEPPTMDSITAPKVNTPTQQKPTNPTQSLMPTIGAQQNPPTMDSISTQTPSTTTPPTSQPKPAPTPSMPTVGADQQKPAGGEKKGSVFSRIGDKIGSKLGGKLGGISKILGGMGGIMSGIAGILFNIFMGVEGFKILFKTVTSVVKGIAKSFSGLFKTLNKTLKPVLKILTKSIGEIVKSVTGIIAPILTALEPILTLLGEAVNTILKPLGPWLEFLGKAVGKIVNVVLKPVEWIAKGVKWLTTKFAKAFGVLMHPFDKKKRAQYYKECGLTDTGEDKEAADKKKKKDTEYKAKSSDEKHEIAEKYSKRLHPVNKEKRQEVYEKMMSGEITEEDAKKMLRKKMLATGAVLAGGVGGIAAYGLAQGAKQVASKVKGGIHDKLTSGNKDEVANRLAKLMYPLNKTKREEIYDQIMSGKLSIEEAEKMVKRKAIDRATTVVAAAGGGVLGVLAKEGVSKTGQALIKYFKERDDKTDEDNKDAQKQHEEEREEDKKLQLKLFKFGPLRLLSGLGDIKDTANFIKGLGISIFGIAESGVGGIIGGLGRIITTVGELASLLPWVNEENKISMLGQSLLEKSDQMTTDGVAQLQKGFRLMHNISTDFGDSNATTIMKTDNASVDTNTTVKSDTNSGFDSSSNGYQTSYSGGDIPYSNADISVIGSGDSQSSYGNYLNMSRRGCGPVALADAYNRRTGSNISASALASKMTSHGTYDPSRGTSVGGYLSASNALGMGTKVGGVTMSSLKKASPNNPITLVGSGVEFGTRNGNNHYLNAIGTDHYGGVYVSNPMTGRIQRRSANSVAGSSLMGIYGSGDVDSLAAFSDETKEAMANLMSLSGIFGKLFNTDSSAEVDEMVENQEKEDRESKIAKEARDNYSDEDYQNKVIKAMDLYRAENPMKDGETPEEYEKRISDAWSSSSVLRNKYISMVVNDTITDDLKQQYESFVESSKDYYEPYVVYQKDAQGNIVHDENGNPIVTGGFKHLLEGEDSEYVKAKKASIAVKKLGEALTATTAANSGGSGAVGGSGGGGGDINSLYAAAAAVFEAAVKNNGGVYSTSRDVGPVTLRDGTELKHFRQDCSGLMSAAVKAMGYNFSSGDGTGIRTYDLYQKNKQDLVVDSEGNPSDDWEILQFKTGSARPGDILCAQEHVGMFIDGSDAGSWSAKGYDGGTGVGQGQEGIVKSGKAGAAYLDGNSDWISLLPQTLTAADGVTRILRFKGAVDSEATGGSAAAAGAAGVSMAASMGKNAQGKIKLSKAMENASPQWKYYPDKLTKADYWGAAKKAGFTAPQTAMVAAIGIHENGAKKLTGEESLTRVVWDNIGKQYAFGLMNWIPDAKNSHSGANETKYGSTLAEQLKYIGETYFSPTSTYDRAKNVNFNRYYGNSMKEALGYAPKLGQGDRWGPYADTDIAEAMGHYVGNALVPYDFAKTTGQARHMRTAVEAYNWMLDNGQAEGYGTGASGGGGGSVAAFDISSILGDYANDLPEYYKNMLGTVQGQLDTTAAAISAANSSSSSFGDYDYDDEGEKGDGEGLEGDTRIYATNTERNDLYHTMKKKHTGGTLWSNDQLTTKGYGDVYLYLEPSTSAKITCKLQNNKRYTKVTTTGSWYFVYVGYSSQWGTLCGWGQMSDFALTSDVKNKSYRGNTVNSINSESDARISKWKGSSENLTFYKSTAETDATGQRWQSYYRNHWFTARGPYTGKYTTKQFVGTTSGKFGTPKTITKDVDAPYVTFSTSYDKTYSNVNRDILLSKTQQKTLKQLNQDSTACGDFDYNSTDSGFFIPTGVYGAGDDTINSIPPLSNNALDTLMSYGYDNEGSYTVNNYTIQGGINNDTADLSRVDLLNYLIKTEFNTRSPRTEKLLNKILDKLENIGTNRGTSTSANSSDMYDDAIPDVITAMVSS